MQAGGITALPAAATGVQADPRPAPRQREVEARAVLLVGRMNELAWSRLPFGFCRSPPRERCAPHPIAMSDDAEFHKESQRLRVVASARDESEYDLFVTAWAAWHGSEPQAQRVDADFGAYLREEAIPAYVRHYVRQCLDARPELLHRHVEDHRAVRRAQRLALVLIILAVFTAVIVGPML